MNVYVAGKSTDLDRVKRVMNIVREAGHKITFDWTSEEGEIRSGMGWREDPEKACEIAEKEVSAVLTADLVILCHDRSILGGAIETGIAVGQGIPVMVLDPEVRNSVFWYLPWVSLVNSEGDLARSLDLLTA